MAQPLSEVPGEIFKGPEAQMGGCSWEKGHGRTELSWVSREAEKVVSGGWVPGLGFQM